MKPAILLFVLAFLPISIHAQQQPAEDVIFMDNPGFSDLEEVLSEFEGKVVLLDFWATWCGPCIAEFASYEALNELRADHPELVILYISLDVNRDTKWKNYVTKKGLKGHHLLVNQALHIRLYEDWDVTTIPRYMIVDRKGEVINRNAPRPSQGKPLIRELERAISSGS